MLKSILGNIERIWAGSERLILDFSLVRENRVPDAGSGPAVMRRLTENGMRTRMVIRSRNRESLQFSRRVLQQI
jgi:hypothetical protein